MSIRALLGGGAGAAPKRKGRPPGKSASPATPAARKPKAGGKPNVRTEAGREQFDQELLAALTAAGGDSVSASTLREAVGGDPNQIRAALNRMIESGVATFSGKARGTRYSLAAGRSASATAGSDDSGSQEAPKRSRP
jgi:hypothetical protein